MMTPPHVAQRKKWYGTQRWKRLRKRLLRNNPICAVCQRVPATAVDHVGHLPDNSTFWTVDNLRPICQSCNSRLARISGQGTTSGRGYSETFARGFATMHGAKESETPPNKSNRLDGLFKRLKEAHNAEPDDE